MVPDAVVDAVGYSSMRLAEKVKSFVTGRAALGARPRFASLGKRASSSRSDRACGPRGTRIRDGGGDAIYVRTDPADEDDVIAAVRATVDTYGKLTSS
jgi:hypothetical protein